MKAIADEAVAAVAVRRARDRRLAARHRCRRWTGRDLPVVAICWRIAVRHLRDRAHRRRRSADDHLHLGHDRASQGRRAHALRLPDQDRAGHGALLRRPRRRDDVLGQRHGLDDGPVGSVRHDAARRHDGALRRRARLSRARSAVGARRAASRQHPRRLADADPRR